MRKKLIVLLLIASWPLAGCYYTKTNPDGTTERISRQEYQRLKEQNAGTFDHLHGSTTRTPTLPE